MRVSGGVTLALVAVTCVLLGIVVSGATRPAAPARVSTADSAELRREIGELREAVRALARALEAGGGAGAAVAPDAATGFTSYPPLSVEELEAAERAASRPTPNLLRLPKNERRIAEIRPESHEESIDVKWRYLFRSYREILEEFGRPDNVVPDRTGVTFYYGFTDAGGNERSLRLLFRDGIIVDVEWGEPSGPR